MALDAVLGHPDHNGADRVEVGLRRGETLGLAGASGGVVLRIEVEDHDAAREVGQADIAPLIAGQAEVGRFVAGLQGGGHASLLIGSSRDYAGRRAEAQSRAGLHASHWARGFPAC